MKKSVKIIIVVFAALILIGGAAGGVLYYSHQQEQKKAEKIADPVEVEKEYQGIRENVIEAAKEFAENKIDFKTLQDINPDAYAWIRIPETRVDYPILQSVTKEDEYYLNTTIDGKKGLPGSVYTEKYNSQSFTDPVTVVYGHNMEAAGTMFTDLHMYGDKEFFDSHPYFYIYLPDRTLKYQVFAAVAFDDRYILGNYNFNDKDDFQKYLDELRSSMDGNVNPDVEVTQESSIVTLSTCITKYPNQRWLVNATLVGQE